MLLIVGISFLIPWLCGFIAFHVTAWAIHVLLVIAVIAFILHLVRRRP